MAATRFLRTSLRHPVVPSSQSSTSSVFSVRCQINKAGLNGERIVHSGDGERKSPLAVKASAGMATASEAEVKPAGVFDLLPLLENVSHVTLLQLRTAVRRIRKPWKFHLQMFIERTIIDCRFFTLFAVAGSLLGSVLCFIEGCFMVLETYLQYFHSLSQRSSHSDQKHMIHLLIEAVDMFIVGTALLIFGVGLYAMFVGSKSIKPKPGSNWLPRSNLFGLFVMKSVPSWVEMQSVTQAKSKIGHAVMMILQVGVLEKLKTVPLITALDLACLAGAVLLSSASIFILSKLSRV